MKVVLQTDYLFLWPQALLLASKEAIKSNQTLQMVMRLCVPIIEIGQDATLFASYLATVFKAFKVKYIDNAFALWLAFVMKSIICDCILASGRTRWARIEPSEITRISGKFQCF